MATTQFSKLLIGSLDGFTIFFQPLEAIQCKEVGYVLRSLGKNPTEDEVINLVCEAACDWEGTFTCDNFLSHSQLLKLG